MRKVGLHLDRGRRRRSRNSDCLNLRFVGDEADEAIVFRSPRRWNLLDELPVGRNLLNELPVDCNLLRELYERPLVTPGAHDKKAARRRRDHSDEGEHL